MLAKVVGHKKYILQQSEMSTLHMGDNGMEWTNTFPMYPNPWIQDPKWPTVAFLSSVWSHSKKNAYVCVIGTHFKNLSWKMQIAKPYRMQQPTYDVFYFMFICLMVCRVSVWVIKWWNCRKSYSSGTFWRRTYCFRKLRRNVYRLGGTEVVCRFASGVPEK